jgi:hypothetical protein
VDPVSYPLLLTVVLEIEHGTSVLAARTSDHDTTEAVSTVNSVTNYFRQIFSTNKLDVPNLSSLFAGI